VKEAAKKNETGAPSALKRLEAHEADAEQRLIELRDRLAVVAEQLRPNADKEEQEIVREQVRELERQLMAAYELWFKLTKQVREFDKSIVLERRDGVKIPQAEVENILTQVFRFDRLAFETHVLSIAQDAIRCRDEQDYYAKFSESHRACRETAIDNGIANEKFPEFVRACYAKSL